MSKDVAQRELDQAGFRITNLGDPKEAGDATKTDNTNAPLKNAGAGSPGTSLLAAPADHVHPAGPPAGFRSFQINDTTEQSVSGDEEVVAEFTVNFDEFEAPNLEATFGAVVKSSAEGHFRLRVDGTPGQPDGLLIAEFSTTSASFEEVFGVGSGQNPGGHGVLKITAQAIGPSSVAHIRSKSVGLEGIAGPA